jgi:hypothetical protein
MSGVATILPTLERLMVGGRKVALEINETEPLELDTGQLNVDYWVQVIGRWIENGA